MQLGPITDLEPLVLEHTLYGSVFARWGKLRLEDHTKGAISDNFALCVLKFSRLAGDSVLDLLLDDFYKDL